jgi:hypothetical protein
LCGDVFGGIGVGGGGQACLSGDRHGLTWNAGLKAGVIYGFEGSVQGEVMLSTGDATTVNDGIGYLATWGDQAGGLAALAAKAASTKGFGLVGGVDASYDPTTGFTYVSGHAGYGAAANFGGYYNTVGHNSGYITDWKTVDSVIDEVGVLTGMW